MSQIVRSKELPGCSRCGQETVLTTAAMPKKDAFGQRIVLELCKACDADKPAAAALVDYFATGGGHDPARSQEGARLLMEWTKEGMAAHGWHWVETGARP
ncbi:DUF6300 family protein [Streptomyces sp. NPDC086783]|uniref:DUF6300 family protein n=1 Tax=Streptomyces sp. NPDC086783 TaxID=3365758 RepID=UPI0038186D62